SVQVFCPTGKNTPQQPRSCWSSDQDWEIIFAWSLSDSDLSSGRGRFLRRDAESQGPDRLLQWRSETGLAIDDGAEVPILRAVRVVLIAVEGELLALGGRDHRECIPHLVGQDHAVRAHDLQPARAFRLETIRVVVDQGAFAQAKKHHGHVLRLDVEVA